MNGAHGGNRSQVFLGLHGLSAVAELKHTKTPSPTANTTSSPRPKCRGRIEAVIAVREESSGDGSPRPKCRGRIEGLPRYQGVSNDSFVLHGLSAVAELKVGHNVGNNGPI